MAFSSRLALWEQKIKEEKGGVAPSPPQFPSVVPGGFLKQLVRETEKESKETKLKEKETKEQSHRLGKLSENLVQSFSQSTENEHNPVEEMAGKAPVLFNGHYEATEEKGSKPSIRKAEKFAKTKEAPKPELAPDHLKAFIKESHRSQGEVAGETKENGVPEESQINGNVNRSNRKVTKHNRGSECERVKDSVENSGIPEEECYPSKVADQEKNGDQMESSDSEKLQEDVWYETDRVWFVHKDGYSLATVLKPDVGTPEPPEGQVRIRVDSDNSIMVVDEENIQRINPAKLDYADDISFLVSLNESSIVNTLEKRYQSQLIHTYAGPNLVVMKPSAAISSYSGKLFKGKKHDSMPPHIYAIAQKAYWNMLIHRRDQTIIPMGRSGAGKTMNCQNVLEYLANVAGSVDNRVSVEKIQAAFKVLNSFGTVCTSQNKNSTRFSMVMSMDFNQAGRVTAAHLQTMLLERMRVAQRPEEEGTFNVFYQMFAGMDSTLRTELRLHQMAESNSFGIVPLMKPEEKQKASAVFGQLQAAMESLGFTASEQRAIWHVLAAIYHLGAAGTCKVGRKQFQKFEWAQNAASVLGCDLEELSTAVFKHHLKQIIEQVTAGANRRSQEDENNAGPKMTGIECVEGMAAGFYEELFAAVVSLINRSFASNQLCLASIMVVDTPGFHNPRHQNKERAATFEELCHNYVHERLQALFYKKTFVSELERYKEENIKVAFNFPESSPFATLAVVDQVSSQFKVQTIGQIEEVRGLLWILDEEVLVQGSSDTVVLDRLCSYFENKGTDKEAKGPVRKCEQTLQLEVSHQLGKDPVRYDVTGWINKAKLNLSAQNAIQVLQESKLEILKNLFKPRSKTLLVCRSVAGLEGSSQQAMQRVGCIRKTFSSSFAAVKRKSVCAQIKLQMDALTNLVKRSWIHFVHCVVPRSEDDSTEVKISHPQKAVDSGDRQNKEQAISVFDIPTVRAQLCGAQLLDALRLYRIGYPDHMMFSEFRRRFQVIAPPIIKKYGLAYTTTDERKVFLKPGVLTQLEKQREKLITQNLIFLQAVCQGFLTRQRFRKLKIQEMAIRCIQKNLAKYQTVKDWPWWQLLCKVRPMLDVNITDEKLRAKEDEVMALRRKLEKSERERNELRQSTDLLESKITDLTAELSDEWFKGEVACQVMETERSERLRVAREAKELQNKYDQIQKNLETVEKQLEEAQLQIQTQELWAGGNGTEEEWKVRFDCAQTEIDFLRKKVAQFEERLESELRYRKELEQKLTDLQKSYESTKQTAQHLKRKCKHLTSDLEDSRLLMESQQNRNHELEKKQKKFDLQLARALGEAAFEKTLREKVTQENITYRGEIYRLQQKIEETESEMMMLHQQIAELKVQLKDLSSPESFSTNSVANLKKQLRELESTIKEQNDEISEQAGTIQQLKQMRLRFEMELERMKQIHQKELEDKEEELEDVRESYQRRLRQFEMQLEQEFEERQLVLHEKQDLEGLIGTLCDQIGHRDFDVEKRLRRDLRRTHALLADAQLLLSTVEDPSQSASKEELQKVRSQLEDSEARCVEAQKAQKSLSLELETLHLELENICRNKNLVDEQLYQLQHEKVDLLKRIDEDQEDLNELMKKHKALIAQSSNDISQIRELQTSSEEAKKEKQSLQEKLQVAQGRVEYLEQSMVERSIVSRQEAIICDLENKVEFQKAQIKRFEMLVLRLRDNMIKMGEELEQAAQSETHEKENAKYYQLRMQEMKVEMDELVQRELGVSRHCVELEMKVEELTAVRQTLQSDLETSIKRIVDLQAALEEESSDESDTESTQAATEPSSRKRDLDSYSNMGSLMSEEPEDGIRSWLGYSAGRSSPFGGSVSGSLSRKSVSDKLSVSSLRISKENKDQDVGRPSSSLSILSVRKREVGRTADKKDFENQSRKTSDALEERTSLVTRKRSPLAEDKSPSSSFALSEFLEELRRKRATEKEQAALGMEDRSTLPIYQTTGASSLRRRPSVKDDDEDSSLSFGSQGLLETQGSSTGTGLIRSVSLRSFPSESSDPTLSPAVKKMAKSGSCESLHLQGSSKLSSLKLSSPIAEADEFSIPRWKPIRKHLELSIEEDGDAELGKDPLVFQNKWFSNLTDEDKGNDQVHWKVPSLSYERKTEDFDDFPPAIKKAQSTSNLAKSITARKEGRKPLSVHFGDLPSNSTPGSSSGKNILSKRSADDLGNLSDSSSSSGSAISYKSADSIKSQPRTKRQEGEGSTGKLVENESGREDKRSEAEGKEDDVSCIMRKYLRKTEND
ncbi:unconventional myosin-XVIIIb isoform X3 [Latimeria chalumnae]|uniref:unconventional myosin-XVIIIb isoform X3 n=1 Tax=Latimeria chalumnae TaxID=7897 RepID=UPI00313ACC67